MIRSIGRVPAERTTSYKIRRMFDATEDAERTESTQIELPVSPAATDTASPFQLLDATDTPPAHRITHGESAY
jgi:hypothetical protein